jgi:hypothetical protein
VKSLIHPKQIYEITEPFTAPSGNCLTNNRFFLRKKAIDSDAKAFSPKKKAFVQKDSATPYFFFRDLLYQKGSLKKSWSQGESKSQILLKGKVKTFP